jgi:hypothetical protein
VGGARVVGDLAQGVWLGQETGHSNDQTGHNQSLVVRGSPDAAQGFDRRSQDSWCAGRAWWETLRKACGSVRRPATAMRLGQETGHSNDQTGHNNVWAA